VVRTDKLATAGGSGEENPGSPLPLASASPDRQPSGKTTSAMPSEPRCASPTRAPPIGALRFRSQIDRTGLGSKQRDYLAQRQVQNFIQIEGLGGDNGHRIERVQLAVTPPHFVFRASLLGDVENEALITLDVSTRIAGRKAALRTVSRAPSLRLTVISKLRT